MAKSYVSRTVLLRQRNQRKLVEALHQNASTLASGLAELLNASLRPNEQMLDWSFMFELFERHLHSSMEEAIACDQNHHTELADDAAVQHERDEAYLEGRALLLDLKDACISIYGQEIAHTLHLSLKIPRSPDAIKLLLEQVQTGILHLDTRPLKPRKLGVSMDFNVYLAPLSHALERLEKALQATSSEVEEAKQTHRAKIDSLQHYDRAHRNIAHLASICAAIVGQPALGERFDSDPSARAARSKKSDEPVQEQDSESSTDSKPADKIEHT